MGASSQFDVKLPLVGKTVALDALPGQDPAKRYGVIWDVCQQPGDGLGYVVEFQDARTCRILAWMGNGGIVTECDRPIAFVMPGVPAIAVLRSEGEGDAGTVRARLHGSDELVAAVGFHGIFPGQVGFEPLTGKGASGVVSDEALVAAVGPYASRKMSWRTFTAVSYLAFYLLPRLGVERGRITGTIGDVLATFSDQPLPDAVDGLVFRVLAADNGEDDGVSGFERYAARMLQQAGAAGVRAIAARRQVGVARLSTTHMFWMRLGDDVEPAERATLLAVEACLNRLALVELALKEQGDSTKLSACREGRCALEDQRALSRIADRARSLVDAAQDENPYCTFIPAQPMRGGEWDVRTRFIRACESLPLPFRLEYRFDCHAEGGVLHAVFGVPPADAFPESRWSAAASRWESRGDERPAFAACYALRLSALVAAAGFGTGLGMRQVLVEGRAGGVAGTPVLSLRFERMSFLNRALYRIDLGTVARVGERGACSAADVRSLYDLLAPMEGRLAPDGDGGLGPIEPLAAPLPPSRIPLADDDRYLPAPLAHLLHADRACDLDIEGQNDLRALDEVQTAIEDAQDSPLLAMARLEEIAANNPVEGLDAGDDVVAAAEAALHGNAAVPGYQAVDDDGTHPVRLAYFPSLFTRCLVDLASTREDEAFEAVPDQAYLARSALARLYLEDGDGQAALARSAECVALAPTSAGSLLEAAQLRLAADDAPVAIDLLRQAMRVCARQQMATALYAHLAGAFWAQGSQREALASFTMARRFERGRAGFDQAIDQLVRQLGLEGVPTVEEAGDILRAQGIPAAPSDEARAVLTAAAVGLADARMFEPAWPLAAAIGFDAGNDVLVLMGESLHEGIPQPR